MNKKILALAAILFAVGLTGGYSLGIGIQGGGHWYGGGFGGGASLLLSPTERIHGAIDWYLGDPLVLGGSLDYWFLTAPIASPLYFYVGFGAGAWVALGDELGLAISPRLPVGIDLVLSPVDIYLQLVPQFAVALLPGFDVGGLRVGGNIGIRFWFDGHNGY